MIAAATVERPGRPRAVPPRRWQLVALALLAVLLTEVVFAVAKVLLLDRE